jgi:small subunit ribosomal protein S13
MPRICGVDIPKSKRVEIALTYLYGIGRTLSNKILKSTNVNPNTRAKDLTEEEISKLSAFIQSNYKIEGDLRREIAGNIKRLIDIGSYKGMRHKRSLPVRGQRTHTNARTRKGPRKTVGVTRKGKTLTKTEEGKDKK